MATERQNAANRSNAKKSTGAKTKAGRAHSAQNARRHGFNIAFPDTAETLVIMCAILGRTVENLAPEAYSEEIALAAELARAEMSLAHVKRVSQDVDAEITALISNCDMAGTSLARGKRAAFGEIGLDPRLADDPRHWAYRVVQFKGDMRLLDPLSEAMHKRRLNQRYLREAEARRKKAFKAWVMAV